MSAAMKLRPTETELIGRWEMADGRVRADATCERIEWLTSSYLEKIAASGGGWETLFRDPDDGRYGNPPILRVKCTEPLRPCASKGDW
jgi:hypothetical protein